MSGSTDIENINLYYHPNCKASSRLLSEIDRRPEAKKLFNYINISRFQVPPPGVQKIPCIEYNKEIVSGKKCFDIVSNIMAGPTSCNIYSTGSKICSFDEKNSKDYQMAPSYSPISGIENISDGFVGVPKYNPADTPSVSGR